MHCLRNCAEFLVHTKPQDDDRRHARLIRFESQESFTDEKKKTLQTKCEYKSAALFTII